MPDTEWEARARAVLAPHTNHTATVNGFARPITTRSLEPEVISWCYAGFVVRCETCGYSLSEQWNGALPRPGRKED